MTTRQARRTAARKLRQIQALDEFKRRYPGRAFLVGRFGARIEVVEPGMLTQHQLQRMVEAHARGFR